MTGHTLVVKTAISLPDDLFDEVDACAARLKVTRSRLFAMAAREFLARHRTATNATQAWDRVIEATGQPSAEPAADAFRKRTRAVVRASGKRRK